MKTKIFYITLIVFLTSGTLFSQDWVKLNPEMNTVLVDTTLMKVYIASIEPGKKSEMHTHPAGFFYALTDCKLKVHYADGQTETFELKPGDNAYQGPEKPHQTENIGNNTAKFILVELKEHPYVAPNSK